MIVSILIFLVMFCVIVVSHEFGHYIIGKRNGIHAKEFFIGIGPKLFHWVKDDTEFSVRLLPFGGACVFEGMDELEDEKEEEDEALTTEALSSEASADDGPSGSASSAVSRGSFLDAPVWARFATTLAGPLFNIILAFIMGVILAGSCGETIPVIRSVVEGSGAEEAGLKEGDLILKINHYSTHLSEEVSFASYYSQGEPMTITYLRDGQKYKTTVTPKFSEEDNRYYIGITNGEYIECKGFNAIKYGFYNVEYILRATLQSLKFLVRGQLSKDDLSGPVGIVKVVDDTYDVAKEYGFLSVLLSMVNITMLLSANLAVMNLLPLPALDGGRLVFLLIEAIRGKPVPPEKEGYVNLAGMALLLILVVFVLFNDITKFFR